MSDSSVESESEFTNINETSGVLEEHWDVSSDEIDVFRDFNEDNDSSQENDFDSELKNETLSLIFYVSAGCILSYFSFSSKSFN